MWWPCQNCLRIPLHIHSVFPANDIPTVFVRYRFHRSQHLERWTHYAPRQVEDWSRHQKSQSAACPPVLRHPPLKEQIRHPQRFPVVVRVLSFKSPLSSLVNNCDATLLALVNFMRMLLGLQWSCFARSSSEKPNMYLPSKSIRCSSGNLLQILLSCALRSISIIMSSRGSSSDSISG